MCSSTSTNVFKANPSPLTIISNFIRSGNIFDATVDISAKFQINTKLDKNAIVSLFVPQDQAIIIKSPPSCLGSTGTNDLVVLPCTSVNTDTPAKVQTKSYK
jgi:hypothetical protein